MPGLLKPVAIALEDGRIFRGVSFGAKASARGEVVFNTSMCGYQEIATDPSYSGQIVVMTAPMIGNYGITGSDAEAPVPHLRALVVKEVSRIASNWRHQRTLPGMLQSAGIPGIANIDTRALVRHLREKGSMRGAMGPAKNEADTAKLVAVARDTPKMMGMDLASGVTTQKAYDFDDAPPNTHAHPLRVVVVDYGLKRSIAKGLVRVGCAVRVVPAQTSAVDILALKPDGVLLSNGPGDPNAVAYAQNEVRALIGRVPLFGICLGHQILNLASGATTYKLPFGHRGGNHPVQDIHTKRVAITAHNHGFSVDGDSLPDRIEVTHIDLNDQTIEGTRLRDAPAFSVQFHPEGAPGPSDAVHLFDDFVTLINDWKREH